jgi:hypothetical protein
MELLVIQAAGVRSVTERIYGKTGITTCSSSTILSCSHLSSSDLKYLTILPHQHHVLRHELLITAIQNTPLAWDF